VLTIPKIHILTFKAFFVMHTFDSAVNLNLFRDLFSSHIVDKYSIRYTLQAIQYCDSWPFLTFLKNRKYSCSYSNFSPVNLQESEVIAFSLTNFSRTLPFLSPTSLKEQTKPWCLCFSIQLKTARIYPLSSLSTVLLGYYRLCHMLKNFNSL
jgi:hypothetical protein